MQNSIHVTPKGNGWQVKRAGAQRASSITKTQKESIYKAREMAKKSNSELYIHGKDNKFREKSSYGNDPRNIKG